MKITTTVEIKDDILAGLLVSAIESGGIRYWCESVEFVGVEGTQVDDEFWKDFPCYLAPFQAGALLVNCDGKQHRCDRAAFENALRLMPTVASRAWSDVVNEDYDATTADIFVQLACFGEVIYG